MKKITIKDIKTFLDAHYQKLLFDIGKQPKYIEEQFAYRMLKCKDCIDLKKCKICKCSTPGRLYASNTCNPDRFPDLIEDESLWEEYKEKNKINDN